MERKIVFLGASDTDIRAQLDKIREYEHEPDWQVVVITTGYGAQRTCQQHGIPFKTTIGYLTTERHYRAFTDSVRLAREWYQQPVIQKALSHDGVSLGEMMEYSMWLLLSGFFLDIELYRGILAVEKPDMIALINRPAAEPAAQNVTDMGVQESFIVNSLCGETGSSLEWIAPLSGAKAQGEAAVGKPFLYRAWNLARRKTKSLVGMVLFLNWRVGIRRELQRLWNSYFGSWTGRRLMRVFSKKERRIVFFGLRCATNIADYLRKDPRNGVICLMGPGEKQRSPNFVPQIYLESFSTPETDRIVEEKRRVFRSILEQAEVLNYLEEKFSYNGLNFWVVARKKLEYILGVYFPLMVRGMELMEEMIDRVGLDVFVASSDANPMIRAMTKALQHKGKKALVLPHGLDYFTPEASEMFGKYLAPPVADKIAAWGEASRDWFVSQGTLPDRVVTTSCGDFDDFLRIFNCSQGALRRYLGIPSDKKVILYALEHGNRESVYPYIGATRDEVIHHLKDVVEEVASAPQLYLIVRRHPGDRHPEEIEQVVRDAGRTNSICPSVALPLIYYLQAADIMMTHTSSSALEAMILGRDVILYNPTGRPEVMAYAQDGAVLKVTRKEELASKILEVLTNDSLRAKLAGDREEFVSRCAGPIDGRATENIANLILEMIKDSREE